PHRALPSFPTRRSSDLATPSTSNGDPCSVTPDAATTTTRPTWPSPGASPSAPPGDDHPSPSPPGPNLNRAQRRKGKVAFISLMGTESWSDYGAVVLQMAILDTLLSLEEKLGRCWRRWSGTRRA